MEEAFGHFRSVTNIAINKLQPMFNPIVIDSRPVLMQRIADAVSRGHTCHSSGNVRLDRIGQLVRKFETLYGVGLDRHARLRARRSGLGSAVLILSRHDNEIDSVAFWLLVTPPTEGLHSAHRLEDLKDALTNHGRISVDGYELVRSTEGTLSLNPGKYRWTWRMTGERVQLWRNSIITAIRQRVPRHELRDMMYSLFRTSPGFRGVRRQIGKLAAAYRAEWKRRRGNEAMEPLPQRLGYVRRLPTTGVSLRALIASTRRTTAATG